MRPNWRGARLVATFATVILVASCGANVGPTTTSPPGPPQTTGATTVSPTEPPSTAPSYTAPSSTAPSSTSTTAAPAASTTTTGAATPTTGALDLTAPAKQEFLDWVGALAAADYQRAWDLMAPSSRAAVGSFELFASFGSAMTEGWGAWSRASDLSVEVEVDLAGRTMAVFSGTVNREGMVEAATVAVFLVTERDTVLISPFEEFGNVAADLEDPDPTVPLPEDSGSGRRIVYANGAQRVWLVDADGVVVDSYLVSGRKGVPAPGVYSVFSKSETAYAGHDGITMRYMVRFARAESGLAIGFHSRPNFANGKPLQTEEQLGEFHSAGCVRQSLGHAAALYDWAPVDTPVHVLP